MAYISGWQFVERAKQYNNELKQQRENIQAQRRESEQKIVELSNELERELIELSEYCLPVLSNSSFQSVRDTLGYGHFLTNNPLQKMEAERLKLEARFNQLNQNPKVVNSEMYIHPRTGNISIKLAESQEQLKIVSQVLSQYEAEPQLMDLFLKKYKTPDYKFRWWHSTYYSDWKWGDIYEEKFGKTIDAMSAEYTSFSMDKATLEESVRDLTKERDQLQELTKELQTIKEALADFPAYTLRQCQQKLASHLRTADKEHLFNLTKGDAARESLVKRIHGIEKKQEYLREMSRKHFNEQEQYINTVMGRVNEKINKYSRYKKAQASIPNHEVDKMLPPVREKIHDRSQRFQKHTTTIYHFNQYDYFDYQRDMLWWDVMTDGRLDGNFIPEVQEFHHHHPGYEYHSSHHHHSDSFFDAGTSISNDSSSSTSFGDPS